MNGTSWLIQRLEIVYKLKEILILSHTLIFWSKFA